MKKKQTKLCRVWNLSILFHASSLAMLIFLYNIFRPLIGLGHRAGNIRLGFFQVSKGLFMNTRLMWYPPLLFAFRSISSPALIAIDGQGHSTPIEREQFKWQMVYLDLMKQYNTYSKFIDTLQIAQILTVKFWDRTVLVGKGYWFQHSMCTCPFIVTSCCVHFQKRTSTYPNWCEYACLISWWR